VNWQSLKNQIEVRICEFSSDCRHERRVFREMLHELITESPLRTRRGFRVSKIYIEKIPNTSTKLNFIKGHTMTSRTKC
jgi:hypothetical protein